MFFDKDKSTNTDTLILNFIIYCVIGGWAILTFLLLIYGCSKFLKMRGTLTTSYLEKCKEEEQREIDDELFSQVKSGFLVNIP